MIHANRIVTVGEQESIIDRPIVLYRGDREVEIEFTLVGNEFTFSEEGNVIKSVNASHGQLVLNTPSGEHMFSELAECHEGKVVFVVTKEMIDEFIEMGFYSFQIRLYDSAEMKSRVTIPPVMNGFDIRNPIAAEDETNVVDQGIVDYARIFKDQSNEELPTFTWDGEYVKTEWAHHDVITENKMNKIEDALYSINANIKESDVVMLNTLDQVKKDADKYVKEHMAEVEADVEDFERNLNTGVEQFKIDTNAAMTAHKNEVSEVVDGFDAQLEQKVNKENIYYVNLNDYKEYTTKYKCKDGTTKTDWGVAINQALSDCIGELIIPYGSYYSSLPIETVNPIKITGMGINASFIKLMPGVELSTDYFFKVNRHYTTLQHLNIQGSLTEHDIKTITGLDLSGSDHLTIENIKVQNFTGDGINIYQPSYDTHLNHVLSWGNQGNGYVLEATDLFLSKCIACEVGEHGFVIKKGNNQLNQCKAYFTGHTGKTGTGDGFYVRTDETGSVASHTTRLLSCEAQETGRHGFYLYNSNSIQLIACQADSGSVHTENSYGYFMKNLKQSNISGVVTNKEFLKGHFKNGSLISGCSGTSIDIKTECVDYYDKYGVEPTKYFSKEVDIDHFNMTNNITINNTNMQPNLFRNECLILDNDDDGLGDYLVDGGSTGGIEYGFSINRFNQAQELKITNTNSSAVDKNCKLYITDTIKNANNFAFSVTTKTTNSKLVPFVRITFTSSDGTTKQYNDYLNSSKYKLLCLNNLCWYTFDIQTEVPDNAISVKIEIGCILKQVGETGSVYYKNLKYNYR